MAFIGPLDSFNSDPIQTKVGTSLTNIFTATSTKVEKDANGKISKATTTLYYSPTAGNYVPAATTTDGGKNWTYLKDSNEKEILGADAKRSLETGALKNNTQQQIVSATTKPLGGGLTKEEQKTVAPSSQNNATTSESDGSQDSAPINADEVQSNLDNLSIEGSDTTRGVKQYPNKDNLRYPIDLKLTEQDCIQFTMLEYSPKKLNISSIAKGDPTSPRDTTSDKVRGSTVTLPIQPSILDNNSVQWNPEELNAPELIASAAALSGILGGGEGLVDSLKAVNDLIGGDNKNIKTAVAAGFAGKAAGTKGLLTRVTGGIVNPNMELLFNGPQLRTFTFSFTLSAREGREARVIRNIIRFFKQGMSVKRAKTSLFLKSPHIFEIKYLHKNSEHKWINKIKECALTNCNVNYTPAGNYATYYDGSMTSYELTLSFNELEPIYDDDYGKGSTSFESEIGY